MKFEPRRDEFIGRIVIKRVLEKILRPDETKDTTKMILVDAVGAGARADGIKKGDVVIVDSVGLIMLDGAASVRPIVHKDRVRAFIREVNVERDLVVQTENGRQYVLFEDPTAAPSLGYDEGSSIDAMNQA